MSVSVVCCIILLEKGKKGICKISAGRKRWCLPNAYDVLGELKLSFEKGCVLFKSDVIGAYPALKKYSEFFAEHGDEYLEQVHSVASEVRLVKVAEGG